MTTDRRQPPFEIGTEVPVDAPVLIERGKHVLVLLVLPREAMPPVAGKPYRTAEAHWRVEHAGQLRVWLTVIWRADASKADHTAHLRWDLANVDARAALGELARHAALGGEATVVLYESDEDRLVGGKGWIEKNALLAAGHAVGVADLDCRPVQQLNELPA